MAKDSIPTESCPCCHHPLAEPLSSTVPWDEVRARLGGTLSEDEARRLVRVGVIPGFCPNRQTNVVLREPFERWITLAHQIPAPPPAPTPPPAAVDFLKTRACRSVVDGVEVMP